MSNAIKVLLIIFLVLIICALSFFMIFVISGKFNFATFGFGQSTNLIEEKEVENVKDIKVKSKTADIYIKHADNDKYKVEMYSDNEKEHTIKLDNNNNLIVELEENNRFFMTKTPRIILYVPDTFENNMTIQTTTGDIEADSYEKANFDIHVTTGDVNINKCNKVDIDGTTGDIEINNVLDIKIKTTTGDIKLGSVDKHLDLTTTTGDITIDSINISENSSISATTGDVKILKKNDIFVEGTVKTGDVKINDNNRHSEIELIIKTTTGDIKVG